MCERLREREIEGEIRDKERKGGREMSKSKKKMLMRELRGRENTD